MSDNNLQVMDDYKKIAAELVKSSLIPKHFKTAPDAWYAILYGREMGLSPIYSLNNVTVINGKPSLSADAMLAVVKSSPEYGGVEVESTDTACKVTLRRVYKNGVVDVTTAEFTIQDAKQAGLFDSPGGMYKKYPKRMLRARAIAYACRDGYGDLLAGNYTEEELRGGIETQPTETKIIDISSEPQPTHQSINQSPANQMELLNMAKECDTLLNSFSMVSTETAEYRNMIKKAIAEKDLTKLEHIAVALQERKDRAIAAHKVVKPVEVEFTPVDQPAPAEEVQPVPEQATSDEAKDEPVAKPTNNDNIIAVLKELFAIDDYPMAHKRNSLNKHLPSVFIAPESSDWESAVQNATIPEEEAAKAIAYYHTCIPAAKKQKKEKQSKQPSWKAQAEAVLKLYPECQITIEMRQIFADAESQPENGDAWQTIYEQAREFLNPAKEQANEAGN